VPGVDEQPSGVAPILPPPMIPMRTSLSFGWLDGAGSV
jgi:hypothetical protein